MSDFSFLDEISIFFSLFVFFSICLLVLIISSLNVGLFEKQNYLRY